LSSDNSFKKCQNYTNTKTEIYCRFKKWETWDSAHALTAHNVMPRSFINFTRMFLIPTPVPLAVYILT
jgi:hypothetical protein